MRATAPRLRVVSGSDGYRQGFTGSAERSGQIVAREDLERERLIEAARHELLAAGDEVEQRRAFEKMRSLILQRSPEVVARMERARGLRP